MQAATRTVIFLVTATVLTQLPCGAAQGATIRVPSREHATIQQAIDAVGEGGTIVVDPGLYTETLVVDGKQVTIRGSRKPNAPSEIVAADPNAAIIAFRSGGGGKLMNLQLRGGAYGIMGESAGTDPSLSIKNVRILSSGRGIFGSFSSLKVLKSQIAGSKWNGISVLKVSQLLVKFTSVFSSEKVGLYLLNNEVGGKRATIKIMKSNFNGNKGGGIAIYGGALPVLIKDCATSVNRICGVCLKNAHDTTIVEHETMMTLPRESDGRWGDGAVIQNSQDVEITGSRVHMNVRAGVSMFGCVDTGNPYGITLKDNYFAYQLFDLDIEPSIFSGCPSTSFGTLNDAGGNVCYGGDGDIVTCGAVSSVMTAPSPIDEGP